MTTITVLERPQAPEGPPKLPPGRLCQVQAETLRAPRLRYSVLARVLFRAVDLGYGRRPTIVKFAMFEFIARVPCQAWERMGYLALARCRGRSALARRVFGRIVATRAEQDNEQWHLLILADLAQRRGLRQSFSDAPAGAVADRVLLLPRVLAAVPDPPAVELPAQR